MRDPEVTDAGPVVRPVCSLPGLDRRRQHQVAQRQAVALGRRAAGSAPPTADTAGELTDALRSEVEATHAGAREDAQLRRAVGRWRTRANLGTWSCCGIPGSFSKQSACSVTVPTGLVDAVIHRGDERCVSSSADAWSPADATPPVWVETRKRGA